VRRLAVACVILAGAHASAQPIAGPGVRPDANIERALAEERCETRDPGCDWVATLSSLERATLVRALAVRGYVVEPSPWNKVIGKVHVYNEDVFAEGGAFLEFFNIFHFTTRESTIRAEAVISPGEVWDQQRVDETARRLRDPLWTSVVAVVPVRSPNPGAIDVLIVTRDIWSLRFNTTYTYQQGRLTNLVTSLSENNLLGRRDVLSAALTMDQGAIAVGPLFIDKNLFGEHYDLRAQVSDIFTRDDLTKHSALHSEGSQSTITLTRPLWSLATEWAAGVQFTHRYAIDRQFLGTKLRAFDYDDPVTMEKTSFGRQYAMRRWTTSAYVTRQWGSDVKYQLSFGHTITSQRPHPLDAFPGTPAQRAAFIARVLPRSEVTSVPFVEWVVFTPRYRTLRNIATFDLAEDTRIGPDLDVSLGYGLELLGSDRNFPRLSSTVGWTLPWARDGFVRVAAGIGGRYLDGRGIDETATGLLRTATPELGGFARLLAQSQVSIRRHDSQNQLLTIGSDSGLRGYGINEFSGQRVFNLQVEARMLPYPIWVLRVGGVVFYDLGGAADKLRDIVLHQDAGVGLRLLVPQTSAQLIKIDFAVPFDGANRGTLRFLAGFGSEF
jgi:hypothetical protein